MSKENPKQAFGRTKYSKSVLPPMVTAEVSLALLEGALKYGSYNFRETTIIASDYFDAADRHMSAWWEGQDEDPDSELSHITKAIASLVVLRDAMIFGTYEDDRPPASQPDWIDAINDHAAMLREKYPPKEPVDQT